VPAIDAQGVSDLAVRDVRVTWEDSIPEYYTSAIACRDVDGVDIDGFRGRGADAVSISIKDSSRVSIRNSRADRGTGTFLKARNMEGRKFIGNDVSDAEQAIDGDPGSGDDHPN
jgi:hypothetical protein